jgi:DNA-binding NtrC family response regulator
MQEPIQRLRDLDANVRALVITGYVIWASAAHLEQKGFLSVVETPLDMEELAQAVRRALDYDYSRDLDALIVHAHDRGGWAS